mgnify:CR=1 FL=1|jgi:hypothetical protein
MSNIIKKNFNTNLLINLINKISKFDDTNKYFILNNESYKKGQINNLIEEFINDIKEYYIKSKKFYLDRTINYKRFLTIIRQLCKSQNIKFEIKINYIKSKYEIIYYIYLENNNNVIDNDHDS